MEPTTRTTKTGAVGKKKREDRPASLSVKPTRRDLAVIQDVARFKFLTSKHVQQKHFAGTKENNAQTRLSKLLTAEFLSRVYLHPKTRGQEKAHPLSVYYFSGRNQEKLKKFLEQSGQISAFEEFQRNLPTYNKNEEFSQLYLMHELGISDFFFQLERETAAHPKIEIAFWERTSPFSKEIGKNFSGYMPDPDRGTTGAKLHFNPDAFFAVRDRESGAVSFHCLELDNNTATAAKFRAKLYGYMAFYAQGHFGALVERYNEKYLLGLRNPRASGLRVLTVVPNRKRRDDLFLDSLSVRDEDGKAKFKMFRYASLPDIIERGALAPVCLRGKEYAPIMDEQKAFPAHVAPAALRKWQDERLPAMKTVSFLDE